MDITMDRRWDPFQSILRAVNDINDLFRDLYEFISYIAVWILFVFVPLGVALVGFYNYCVFTPLHSCCDGDEQSPLGCCSCGLHEHSTMPTTPASGIPSGYYSNTSNVSMDKNINA